MLDCIFCKIINKELKANIVYQDQDFIVFKDIKPKAETHLLIVPKKHIESLNELEDIDLAGKMLLLAKKIIKDKGYKNPLAPLAEPFNQDYKIQINVGKKAGQIIDHLHLHLLSGRMF